MTRTLTEKMLIESRRERGVIVPLLTELFTRPVEVTTDQDVIWRAALDDKTRRRDSSRDFEGTFSPSALASCLRKVYLNRHWRDLGLERVVVPDPQAHYTFFTGDEIHRKWQFACYKLDQGSFDFQLLQSFEPDDPFFLGCEIPVASKHGDHKGTLDVLALVGAEPVVLDFKGLNPRGFQSASRGDSSLSYKIQLADYMMLVNTSRHPSFVRFRETYGKVERGFILTEAKAGANDSFPIALHETEIRLKDYVPAVRQRLEELRRYEAEKEIPAAECRSVRGFEFRRCPFAEFCRKEVLRNERADDETRESKGFELARPGKRRRRRS